MDFTRCWENSFEISIHVETITCNFSCCQFSDILHQDILLDSDPMTWRATKERRTQCQAHEVFVSSVPTSASTFCPCLTKVEPDVISCRNPSASSF